MTNTMGMIKEGIWRDPEFRRLPRTAQCLYAQLLSQKDLDRAGVLPLRVGYWAKGCDEMSETEAWHDLKLLAERRFIIIDEDTDEVFIRSYMRHNGVAKYPQFVKSAVRSAWAVESPMLRYEVAIELRKLGRAEATKMADQLDLTDTVRESCENSADTMAEPHQNSAGTVNGAGTVPERGRSGSRSGSRSPTVVGHLGEAPPPNFCSRHMPDGTTEPCGQCAAARRTVEAWEEQQAQHRAAHAAARRAAINACPHCDDTGLREIPGGVTRCSHEVPDA